MYHHRHRSGFINSCERGAKRWFNDELRRVRDPQLIDEGFEVACQYEHLHLVDRLLQLDGDLKVSNDALNSSFSQAASQNRVHVAKCLLRLEGGRIDVHAKDDYAFRYACMNGQTDGIEFLLQLGGVHRVDVHADDEGALRGACTFGQLAVVKRLLGLEGDRRIDVHARNEEAFRNACGSDNLDLIDYLLHLKGDRRVNVHACGDDVFVKTATAIRDVKFGFWAHERLRFDRAVMKRLLSLRGDRAIPLSLMVKHGLRHEPLPVLIAEWAHAREARRLRPAARRGRVRRSRGSSAVAQVWHNLPRAALAEVLQQVARPITIDSFSF